MILAFITFVVAVTIAVIAAWFSIVGLMAIFAASAIPVAIMAGALEVGKLVSASWVYRNWSTAPFLLKSYLTAATVVLMLITSLGIFGFLSKAHIEQTSQMTQSVAVIGQYDSKISTIQGDISALEKQIQSLVNQSTDNTTAIQAQIDTEQNRKDQAYARIQPAIDEQNAIISAAQSTASPQVNAINQKISITDADLSKISTYIESDQIAQLQAMVGVKADGNYGSQTVAAVEAYKTRKSQERDQLLIELATAQESVVEPQSISDARAEIVRLRGIAENEAAASQKTIDDLRAQLANVAVVDNTSKLSELRKEVVARNADLADIIKQKFDLETEVRKLEAEVGPIKYIAEVIYGDTEKSTIDTAVRGLIILFILVFDPLAILLLIAANHTLKSHGKTSFIQPSSNRKKKNDDSLSPTARAEKINVITEPEIFSAPSATIINKPTGWLDDIQK